MPALFRALRPHQWVKNVLLFVPLVTAHRVLDAQAWADAARAFAAMCFMAAAAYVANDLVDLDADRAHPTKRFRPFASGELAVWIGFALLPILATAALLIAITLPVAFVEWLGIYGALALLYSFWFKRFALVDVTILALLYSLRLLAGAAAIAVPVSAWLIAFSVFFFFSLALAKRHAEIRASRELEGGPQRIRGYRPSDLETVAIFGIASGYLSVLVMALYTDSREIAHLYTHPIWLWGFSPLLLLWVSRLWLYAARGQLQEDPVLFATKDWSTYAVLIGLGACMYFAT